MRGDNSTIFLVIVFIVMAATTKIPMFFLIAFFFVFRMLMKSNKKKQKDSRYDRSQRKPQGRVQDREIKARQQQAYQKRANPFKKSGIRKYKEFELEDAIIDFNKGLEIDNRDVALHFNIACAYSLTEQKEKAYHHIKKAVEYGFKDYEKIQTHDDLAFIRIQPEFEPFKKSGFTSYKVEGEAQAKQVAAASVEEEVKDDVLLSQLNKLAELRKKGLLSEQEFAYERKKLLSR